MFDYYYHYLLLITMQHNATKLCVCDVLKIDHRPLQTTVSTTDKLPIILIYNYFNIPYNAIVHS
jgi:hypothetical protein